MGDRTRLCDAYSKRRDKNQYLLLTAMNGERTRMQTGGLNNKTNKQWINKFLQFKSVSVNSAQTQRRVRFVKMSFLKCDFQLTVVKRKLKELLLFNFNTTDENSVISQSEFNAHTCSRRQAREHWREKVTIVVNFASHWMRKWREVRQPVIERS